MADIPSDVPEWASDPPADTITTPTSTQREDGWQPGSPRRQFMNWLQNLVYQWVLWFRQSVFRTSDFAADQAFGGAAPATGAGLTVAANSFSATAYVDGYRVATTSAQAYTYSANSDTYWDLGRDAVWRPVVVASGAGEPAVTSSPPSVRVFVVRTNGTNRTLVTDRRLTRVTLSGSLLDILTGLRLGFGRAEDEPALSVPIQDGSGAAFVLLQEWTADPGGQGTMRLYATSASAAQRRLVITEGAEYVGGATPWLAEIDDPTRMDLVAGLRYMRATGINATDAFLEADWSETTLPLTGNLNISGTSSVGTTLTAGTSLAVGGAGTGRLPILDADGATAIADGAVYVPIVDDGETTLYRATNALGTLGPALVIARNAAYDRDASAGLRWERRTAGQPASLTVFHRSRTVSVVTAHTSTAWDDTIGTGNWSGIPGTISYSGLIAAGTTGVQKIINGPGLADGFAYLPSGSAEAVWWDLPPGDLPHGAIIASALIRATNPVDTHELRGAVVRINIGSGAVTYMSASGTYTVLTEDGSAAAARTIETDAAEATRTVDRTLYRYAVFVAKTTAAANVEIQECRVTYTL